MGVERGARTVLIRPAPVPACGGSRSFGFEEFDPFWQAVVDADILVSMHASDSGYSRYQADWTGPQEMLPFRPDAFRMLTMGKRPDRGHHVRLRVPRRVTRFPDLKDRRHRERRRLGGAVPRPPRGRLPQDAQAFDEDPIEAFKRNVWISPFHEDDIDGLIEAIGADHVLFGSDYPHPEGLAEPCWYLDHLPPGLSEDVAAIMGGNLGRLMASTPPHRLVQEKGRTWTWRYDPRS